MPVTKRTKNKRGFSHVAQQGLVQPTRAMSEAVKAAAEHAAAAPTASEVAATEPDTPQTRTTTKRAK